MYGKTLKELNNISVTRKVKFKNFTCEKISSEEEFSYFRVKLNKNMKYKINHKSFYLFLNKGIIFLNKKKYSHDCKHVFLSKSFLYLTCATATEIYIFFFKKVAKIKIDLTEKNLNKKVLVLPIKTKEKYWGYITDLVQQHKGAIKIIEMKKNTQSSMEFHIKKKENYFLEYGSMDLGIRYSRGLNGIIKLKKNNSFLMKPGTMHMRMAKQNCKIIEMSTKDHDNDSIIVHDGKKYKFRLD